MTGTQTNFRLKQYTIYVICLYKSLQLKTSHTQKSKTEEATLAVCAVLCEKLKLFPSQEACGRAKVEKNRTTVLHLQYQ